MSVCVCVLLVAARTPICVKKNLQKEHVNLWLKRRVGLELGLILSIITIDEDVRHQLIA